MDRNFNASLLENATLCSQQTEYRSEKPSCCGKSDTFSYACLSKRQPKSRYWFQRQKDACAGPIKQLEQQLKNDSSRFTSSRSDLIELKLRHGFGFFPFIEKRLIEIRFQPVRWCSSWRDLEMKGSRVLSFAPWMDTKLSPTSALGREQTNWRDAQIVSPRPENRRHQFGLSDNTRRIVEGLRRQGFGIDDGRGRNKSSRTHRSVSF